MACQSRIFCKCLHQFKQSASINIAYIMLIHNCDVDNDNNKPFSVTPPQFQGHSIFDATYMASSVSDTRCAGFSAVTIC